MFYYLSLQQVENLSNESLVRKASLVVFDSANTYLSQTTLALVDSLTQYAKVSHFDESHHSETIKLMASFHLHTIYNFFLMDCLFRFYCLYRLYIHLLPFRNGTWPLWEN